MKEALLGVHERAKEVPIEPSKLDIEFLDKKYGLCIYMYLSRYTTNFLYDSYHTLLHLQRRSSVQ